MHSKHESAVLLLTVWVGQVIPPPLGFLSYPEACFCGDCKSGHNNSEGHTKSDFRGTTDIQGLYANFSKKEDLHLRIVCVNDPHFVVLPPNPASMVF